MRIRDKTISKERTRATNALLPLARARRADVSNAITGLVLRQIHQSIVEEALHTERTLRVANFAFSLERLDDSESLKCFCFTKSDIYRITRLMEWPCSRNVTARRRYRTHAVLSFCVLCRRLGTVCRWWDLEAESGCTTSVLKEFYEALDEFYSKFSTLVSVYRQSFLSSKAATYAAEVSNAGAPLDKCVGFMDGTNLYISRPKGSAQHATYIGHKRRNCLKFQALSTPDGLIFHIFGPVEGRRHDMMVYRHSNIDEELSTTLCIYGTQYYIYGDPAYVIRPYLIIGYGGAFLTEKQKQFNKEMSACRTAVQWALKDIKKYFSHVSSATKMRIECTPAALWYFVSALLWNFRACLYGSQSATAFNCAAPTLEEYVATIPQE
ncbi:hypothetical protein BWQ96_03520 [Gracilariopsis chorda]|uniref:DDE Tnp4 domain-containing protein n=1 Tax=Gracilariopsis chorda TaxID=448386 RepID=A0A2V3IX07_9FLOR|nr:hypothetical protein BWQ96_03520 [Gracilariopsis chorda]|eukprot:PXF46694.1 hypothetical protein BWQ96_03520 [Gracilariopsis chorda]